MKPEYIFKNAAGEEKEYQRLRAIEDIFDPSTRRRLEAAGVKEGYHCLEIGPGAGSILQWLSARVGPGGEVTAVDIDTHFLERLSNPRAHIIRGDIRQVPFPQAHFDLIHARYVFVHMLGGEAALERVVSFLRPGGWLVIEEPDFTAARPLKGKGPALAAVRHVNEAMWAMFRQKGLDPAFGLRLSGLFKKVGLSPVSVECDSSPCAGGAPLAAMMGMSAARLADQYVATGEASAEDVQAYEKFADDPSTEAVYYASLAATGRK